MVIPFQFEKRQEGTYPPRESAATMTDAVKMRCSGRVDLWFPVSMPEGIPRSSALTIRHRLVSCTKFGWLSTKFGWRLIFHVAIQ